MCEEVGVAVCATDLCPSMYLLLVIAVLLSRTRAQCLVVADAQPTVSSKEENVAVTSGTKGLDITSVIFKTTSNI